MINKGFTVVLIILMFALGVALWQKATRDARAAIDKAAGTHINIRNIDIIRGVASGNDGCNEVWCGRLSNGTWSCGGTDMNCDD